MIVPQDPAQDVILFLARGTAELTRFLGEISLDGSGLAGAEIAINHARTGASIPAADRRPTPDRHLALGDPPVQHRPSLPRPRGGAQL